MRVLSFTFAIIALTLLISAFLVSAGAPSLSICSGADALLEGATITTDSQDWQPSTTVHFTISGNLKSGFSDGSIDTYATFDGIEVANKQDPICSYEGTPFKCPEAAGTHSWTFPFEIPEVPWSGSLSSKAQFKTGSGQSIVCMNVEVSL